MALRHVVASPDTVECLVPPPLVMIVGFPMKDLANTDVFNCRTGRRRSFFVFVLHSSVKVRN